MRIIFTLLSISIWACSSELSLEKDINPNIVIIYADDMGYGDLACQNAESKIPTPYLDQLASEGMRLTDAHSSSGICSPSRYALLTGRYHWRQQHDIVQAFGPPFFRNEDITMAHLLQKEGYHTACIGKWHLGWDWKFLSEPSGQVKQGDRIKTFYKVGDIDFRGTIPGGPLDRGFDYYFGDGTINFPPYAWIENDQLIEIPTEDLAIDGHRQSTKEGSWEFRLGPTLTDWDPYEVLPTLTKKACHWIENQKEDQPFFLYFSLPSPHAPIIPNEEFVGQSEAGGYGDFMVQTDWVVGQILERLKLQGLEENTLVIFTSDNGPERYAFERLRKYQHSSMGSLRGLKRDIWEGGHRIPFLIKWPGRILENSTSNEVLSQVDIFRTLCSILKISIPEGAAPDSYDFSPVFLNQEYTQPLREATVHNTYADKWALRQGSFVYLNVADGSHSRMPDYFKTMNNFQDFATTELLFDLSQDVGQRENLSEKYPEKVSEMRTLLEKYRTNSSSLPGNYSMGFQ